MTAAAAALLPVLAAAAEGSACGPLRPEAIDQGGEWAALQQAAECDGRRLHHAVQAAQGTELAAGAAVPAAAEGTAAWQPAPCRRPRSAASTHLFNSALLSDPLQPGRRCWGARTSRAPSGSPRSGGRKAEGGYCAKDRCGVLVLDGVASPAEAAALAAHYDALHAEVAMEAKSGTGYAHWRVLPHQSARRSGTTHRGGHLLLLRVMERLRRALSYTFEVGLRSLHFVECQLTKGNSSRRGRGDGHTLHCDEASYPEYHYSGVLWLNTAGADFGGGELVWYDPAAPTQGGGADRAAPAECAVEDGCAGGDHAQDSDAERGAAAVRGLPRRLAVQPRAGRAVLFSSGWENPHRVAPVDWGERRALAFFMATVAPPPVRGRCAVAGGGGAGAAMAAAECAQRFREACMEPPDDGAAEQCAAAWRDFFAPQQAK